jgi:hypothetical protein
VPRKTADKGNGEYDASSGREEILMRQAQHLHEIGERAFTAVVLPIRVGDEADSGVKR